MKEAGASPLGILWIVIRSGLEIQENIQGTLFERQNAFFLTA